MSDSWDPTTDESEETSSELIPYVDWSRLPTLDLGAFISSGANPVDLMCKELSAANSRRTYKGRLNMIGAMLTTPLPAEQVPWHQIRYAHVVQIRDALQAAGAQPATLNGMLSAIRKVTKVCVHLNLMSRDDMLAIHDIKMMKYQRLPAGREVRAGELEAIIRACRDDKHNATGWRDIAVFGFLYICGLRRFEVVSINVEDVDLAGATARVIGKGNKEKKVFLDPGTITAVERWLSFRLSDTGPMFLPVNKGGVVQFTNRISDQTIYNIVRKRQKQANVQKCSPHDFRRSFGTELLRQGIDLPTVQRLMGHADPSTTARYDVRRWEEDRAATRGLLLPVR